MNEQLRLARRPIVGVLAVVALALGAGACSAENSNAETRPERTTTSISSAPATTTATPPSEAATSSSPATTSPPESSTTPAAERSPWQQIVPGDDCMCADGSEYSFWLREASPSKVVLFLEGGGACFSAESCAFTEGAPYQYTFAAVDNPTGTARNPNDGTTGTIGGIFDFEHAGNPFADYSVVYVPYCTGDSQLGDTTREYTPELTVEHNGFVNSSTAMSFLVDTFPNAEQVVVIGESAGGVAAPVYAGLLSDELADTQITVLTEGSGAYPPVPALYGQLSAQWGTSLPDWALNDVTSGEWTVPDLYARAAEHDPDIVWGRHEYTADLVQTQFYGLLGLDPMQLAATMVANEEFAEAGGVDLKTYTAPGDHHVVFQHDAFYTEVVADVALADWVDALVHGGDVEDVR